ncbi:MAG: SMP-30/gluconolactonase/LRE family protein [Pseudohongiella sp.]|nr:SMP-30/gluconolactonase/LRE family protein [Pseudohongiella sp.]
MTIKNYRNLVFGVFAALSCSSFAQQVSLVAPDATITLLSDQFTFTEGPVADASGNVYFSDIPANRIHVWTVAGELETFREQTNGTNGLFFDTDWQLFGAEGGAGRITRMDNTGAASVVVDQHNGLPFNSPNDLWIDAAGGIYFTDPRYGDESSNPQPGYYVYYLAPGAMQAQAIITDLVKPNGVIGTRDGSTLYVADHLGNQTFAYTLAAQGQVSNKRLIAAQGSDGLTLDETGNLYLTGGRNVSVYSADGQLLQAIEFPLAPANMTFGGANRDILFVTARTSLFALQMAIKGMY